MYKSAKMLLKDKHAQCKMVWWSFHCGPLPNARLTNKHTSSELHQAKASFSNVFKNRSWKRVKSKEISEILPAKDFILMNIIPCNNISLR
jgi:hypothetical protein